MRLAMTAMPPASCSVHIPVPAPAPVPLRGGDTVLL
eukprot:CAMPEP_0119351996 /NCGR_PEP_ID=MMETSP1334-20130426/1278_1 /TAXON_ID=127549 /ORGANISM="Calcidiscus leptoporus, Strain RCC1130" /LENGTH=35 /DNA_ID= /DNA_START= /DNA_END= /DNA_ORIENTATION=